MGQAATAPTYGTELRCLAPHPFHQRRPHRVFLLKVPFYAQATDRILDDMSHVGEDCIGALCHVCRRITEYRIVKH